MNETTATAHNKAPTRSGASRAVSLTAAIVGAVVLLGVGSSAALATAGTVLSASAGGASSHSVSASGVTALDVQAEAADLTIEFGDVDEATLNTNSNLWQLERSGDELIVQRDRWFFSFWCFGACDAGARGPSILTLPMELNGSLNADVTVGAGNVNVEGDFAQLAVSVGAGEADIRGAAETLNIGVDAGRANLELQDVREADIRVDVGDADVTLMGDAPSRVGVTVSVGDATISLPQETYDVRQNASVGTVDNRLSTNPSSELLIDAEVSVGNITLRYI